MAPRPVEKPWGRTDLAPPFAGLATQRGAIGEIIFDPPVGSDPELLVKFLFTSAKLSIQVHPGADEAGGRRGKDEAWVVIGAEPGATIGIGLRHPLSKAELRAAALDGSLEAMVDWRPVKAGDCFYSPAGTIHAIGPGLSLVEIQQNCDVTYRLYDYGRPRELHLDEAVDVARPEPAAPSQSPLQIAPHRTRMAGGAAFQVEKIDGPQAGRLVPPDEELWLISVDGHGSVSGSALSGGHVWRIDEPCTLQLDQGSAFLAYPGKGISPVWEPGPARIEE